LVGKRMRVGPGEEAADAVNLGDLIAGGPGSAFAEAKAARNATVSFATIPILRGMKNSCADGLNAATVTATEVVSCGQEVRNTSPLRL
jgi:hypothetical protein